MENKISIALCCYNGEMFLEKQLNSINQQTILPYEIIICDDGSTDNTEKIVEKFISKTKINVKFYKNMERLNVVKNFEKAIRLCEGKYIALSDQDDIWLPNKLENALKGMKQLENEYGTQIPLLVHTDLCLIDENDKMIKKSFMQHQHLHPSCNYNLQLKQLILQNYVVGCTCFFNQSLQREVTTFPKGIVMHDWWLALVAVMLGKIKYFETAEILYRQHSRNVVGIGARGFVDNIQKVYTFDLWRKNFEEVVHNILILKKWISEKNVARPQFLQDIFKYLPKGGIKAILCIVKHRLYKQGCYCNIFYLVSVMFCKLKDK